MDLVRIGDPLRPEFAAWRYGDQFGRRRRRSMMVTGGVVAVAGGLVVATSVTGILTGAGYALWSGGSGIWDLMERRRVAAVVSDCTGRADYGRHKHLDRICLHLTPVDGEWGVHVPHDAGVELFLGDQARRPLRSSWPRLNAAGASQRKVKEAVREIESQGDPTGYLHELAAAMSPAPTGRMTTAC